MKPCPSTAPHRERTAPLRTKINSAILTNRKTMMHLSIDEDFLTEFKHKTEAFWAQSPISGFQSPRGARWNPGLSDEQIEDYEKALGVHFPYDFRLMLRFMNGTFYPDETIEPRSTIDSHRKEIGIYSFPKDIELMHQRIHDLELESAFVDIQVVLHESGFELEAGSGFVPIYGHRYIHCSSNPIKSTVLSIVGTDAIVVGYNLREYLQKEFLPASNHE